MPGTTARRSPPGLVGYASGAETPVARAGGRRVGYFQAGGG
ncbi:hypothetical protein [Kibdelosporangium philippinense]